MWSWWSLWFLVKWSKFQNQVKKNLDFFLFFLYFHIFSSLQNWQMVSWQSVFRWSNIAGDPGTVPRRKKMGKVVCPRVARMKSVIWWCSEFIITNFFQGHNKLPAFETDFLLLLFFEKKQTCFILFIPGSFIQSWGYFKMRLDFAVEVVGHTRSESSKDLGRAIGPGNFAACAVRMESFGRKPHAQNPPKCPAAEGISLEGLVQGQPWIILPE